MTFNLREWKEVKDDDTLWGLTTSETAVIFVLIAIFVLVAFALALEMSEPLSTPLLFNF